MKQEPPPSVLATAGAALLARPGLVLLVLALWLLAPLGLRPLMLPDEGRYVGVAREMLLGDGLVPTLHGLPFFHKPPLMYWIDMTAMRVLGINVFAARMAPFIGAWLMGAALYLDLQRRVGRRDAAIVLGVLATCPFFFAGSQYANHDMLVAGLITVAVICAQRALDDAPTADLRWVVAAWSAMALALLAKGLIGVVLPALIVGPWLLAQGRWRQLLRLLHPLALLAFVLIAAPWFLAVQSRYPAFFDYFFVEQHFRRFAMTGFNNVQPWWFFVLALPALTLPWSLWLAPAVRLVRRGMPHGLDETPSVPRTLLALYAWWIVVVAGFFSLPSSKLIGYVLPAVAPMCALLGLAILRGRAWRWVMPLSAISCLCLVAGVVWKSPHSHRDIGLALGQGMQPGDRVVFVDDPFYDVPFYARLTQPPIVLSRWDDPDIPRRDNWRKELYDAGRFDPEAAALRLWRSDRAVELLCAPGTVWFLADKGWQAPPELGDLTRVRRGSHGDLFRATGGPRPGCP